MKKRFGVAAIAAAASCAIIFAGCTGCNGCGANGKANEAAFSSNWYADTSYRYIQPTFIGEENAEVISYTVKQDKESAGNSTYSVEYGDGTYKTKFYAVKFNKDLIDEEFKGDYPDEMTVYCYKTELEIPSVTFKVTGNDTPATFNDGERTYTECYFTDVNGHLRPLYSKIDTKCYAPTDFQVGILENSYEQVSKTVTTSYRYDGSAAKTVTVDNLDSANNKTETVSGLNDTDNSLIDVCGLNVAVRAMQLSANLAQTISIYSPAGKMQNYSFTGSAGELSDDERTAAENILASDGINLFDKGADNDKKLSTVCVTATLGTNMNGVSQRYWFASIDNLKNNVGRATMVKYSVPLPFNLGTMNYTLKEITSTLYNK